MRIAAFFSCGEPSAVMVKILKSELKPGDELAVVRCRAQGLLKRLRSTESANPPNWYRTYVADISAKHPHHRTPKEKSVLKAEGEAQGRGEGSAWTPDMKPATAKPARITRRSDFPGGSTSLTKRGRR